MRDNHRSLSRWLIPFFVLLAFIAGMKLNSLFLKTARPVESIDITKYETDFRNVYKLLSQNTLTVYWIADAITNSWVRSLALNQDSSQQIEKVFSELENNGMKAALSEKNEKIKEGMIRLKKYPFKYREAYKILEDTYTVYTLFYKFVLNPAVSLMIYSKQINELEGELAKNFNRLTLYAPKVAEHTGGDGQLVSEKRIRPEVVKNKTREEKFIPTKIEDLLGKSSMDVEKMMGPPQFEICAQTSGGCQKEYEYNGQKIKVYYRGDQVTGLSN